MPSRPSWKAGSRHSIAVRNSITVHLLGLKSMDRREALELIIAKSPDDRLRAARALNQVCEAEDIPKLETALSTETNKWVKGALSKALQSMRSPGVPLSIRAGAETEEERQSREIYANAMEETTSRLVHEIRPILGRLDVAAAAEIPNYDRSETKAEWNSLEELLNAIDAMRHAASAPVYKEFDLAGLLQRVITSETGGCPVTVQSA